MSRRAWVAFAGISVIWGIPYLFIKLADDHGMPAFSLAWGRVAIAAALLGVIAWRRGTLGQLRGRGRWLLAYALAEICGPFPLIALGKDHVPSSLAAIVIASVPLIVAVLNLRFDHSERLTRARGIGLLVGFAGVITLVGVQVASSTAAMLGTGALLLASIGYAIGPMVVKLKLADLDPAASMGGSLMIATVLLAAPAAAQLPQTHPSAGALGCVAVLGVVCTAAAFVVYSILIQEAGTSRATVITYVNPVIAVALGVILLGERPGAGAVAGLLLILAGSWLSTGGRLPPRRPRRTERSPLVSPGTVP